MRDIWLIADTHFGHARILTFTGQDGRRVRPEFSSVKEMDEAMVERWNRVVKPQDIVYHLGDVYFADGWKNLKALQGRKRLIVGNHDDPKDKHLYEQFQKILLWRKFTEFGLLLTHVPVHPYSLDQKHAVNVHGHIHERTVPCQEGAPDPRYRNVGVELNGYKPVHIEELRRPRP